MWLTQKTQRNSFGNTPGKARLSRTRRAAITLSLMSPTSGYLRTTAVAAEGCSRARACSLRTCAASGLACLLSGSWLGRESGTFLYCLEEPNVWTACLYPAPAFEDKGPCPKAPAMPQIQHRLSHHEIYQNSDKVAMHASIDVFWRQKPQTQHQKGCVACSSAKMAAIVIKLDTDQP